MRCRYCFHEGEWRVEVDAYVCDEDYNYPPVQDFRNFADWFSQKQRAYRERRET